MCMQLASSPGDLYMCMQLASSPGDLYMCMQLASSPGDLMDLTEYEDKAIIIIIKHASVQWWGQGDPTVPPLQLLTGPNHRYILLCLYGISSLAKLRSSPHSSYPFAYYILEEKERKAWWHGKVSPLYGSCLHPCYSNSVRRDSL